jgi:hypothetical protein
MSKIIGLKKYLPEFLDVIFLEQKQKVYAILLEYINQSLEDHINSLEC